MGGAKAPMGAQVSPISNRNCKVKIIVCDSKRSLRWSKHDIVTNRDANRREIIIMSRLMINSDTNMFRVKLYVKWPVLGYITFMYHMPVIDTMPVRSHRHCIGMVQCEPNIWIIKKNIFLLEIIVKGCPCCSLIMVHLNIYMDTRDMGSQKVSGVINSNIQMANDGVCYFPTFARKYWSEYVA